MAYDVTSWFESQALDQSPDNIIRKFTIGSSDYSERVMKWPSFNKSWNGIRPVNLNMRLANADQGMEFFREDKTKLRQDCTIEFGFTHPTSGDELITLFAGKTERVKYSKEQIDITIVDKFKQLTERVVGSSDVPVSFTGSSYLPSDIVWWMVTSYGGYSTIESTSNPDINYTDFLTWANIFSSDAIFMRAEFTGQKVSEILRKFGRHTYSAIFIEEDRITFDRFGLADLNVSSLDNTNIDDLVLSFDDIDMVNKQYVFSDYDISSKQWATTVIDQSSSSVNSFGLKEETEKDANIWYVGSGGALNLAQRMTAVKGEPYDKIEVTTFLPGIIRLVGETVSIVDSFHSISQSFRIMEHRIDMDRGIVKFDADRSQYASPFILDTSELDSTDVLT